MRRRWRQGIRLHATPGRNSRLRAAEDALGTGVGLLNTPVANFHCQLARLGHDGTLHIRTRPGGHSDAWQHSRPGAPIHPD
jgi:hypothetical protein